MAYENVTTDDIHEWLKSDIMDFSVFLDQKYNSDELDESDDLVTWDPSRHKYVYPDNSDNLAEDGEDDKAEKVREYDEQHENG